jgi:hypothetical protein
VQGHAARAAHGLVQPLAGEVLLVLGVPGLVQDAHQRLGEVVLVVAGGDADVAGDAAAEGVVADIETAVIEVEADPLHQLDPQPALALDGEGSLGHQHRGARLRVHDLLDESRQEAPEPVEERGDGRRAPARLEAVDQSVVEAEAELAGQGGGHLALARHHLFQQRREGGPVALRAQGAPGLLAARLGA